MITALKHSKGEIKLKFVTLTTFKVFQDLGIDPENASTSIADFTKDTLKLIDFMVSIIYNGMKVYYKDVEKNVPYTNSEICDIVTKELDENSNLEEVLEVFTESCLGVSKKEDVSEVVGKSEKKK